jgi:hypothetical protein
MFGAGSKLEFISSATLDENEDLWCCINCDSRLVELKKKECTFRENDHVDERGVTFKCKSKAKSLQNFTKLAVTKGKMPKGSEFCGVVAKVLAANEDALCCQDCVLILLEVKKECTFRENDHVDERGVTFKCKSKVKSLQNFTKLALTEGKMPKGSEFCGVVAKVLAANKDAWCCKGCGDILMEKGCTFRKNNHMDDNGVTLKCRSKAVLTPFYKLATITKGKMPKGGEFCGVVAKALAANEDAWCCKHCRQRLFTLPPPPAGDFFKPRSSKKQKISK